MTLPEDTGGKSPRPPLFLARQTYRRRRMMDASRLLPVLGFFLFALPILWHPADTAEPDTAKSAIYVFVVWLGLIVMAFLLARGLAPAIDEAAEDGSAGGT